MHRLGFRVNLHGRQSGQRPLLLDRSQEYAFAVRIFVEPEQLPASALVDDGYKVHRVSGNGYSKLNRVAPGIDWIGLRGSREGRGIRAIRPCAVEDEER